MNTMPDPTCPNCGQECEVAVTANHLIFVCVPCRTRERAQELQKLAEWNAWARQAAATDEQEQSTDYRAAARPTARKRTV